ncbi:MAG TPA: hypothetical protein PJ991_08620 [Kiritimatiellia bacterium]|nr:hypothetical protein [Kiritimatiellia bacterium]
MIKQFHGIASLTALEASRQPIFLLLTTSVILFIALLPVLITHVLGDSARMIRDSALALQLISGLVLGCFAATSTISRELKRGTLASILSKPVGRTLFFLAKFWGVTIIMLVYSFITTLAVMMSVRTAAEPFHHDWWGIGPLLVAVLIAYLWVGAQNYFLRVPFVSRAYLSLALSVTVAFLVSCVIPAETGDRYFGVAIPWNILPAGLLISMAMILFSAFSVSLATRFDMVPTFSICLVVFLIGLMSDYLFGRHADANWMTGFIYGIIPNWQHFWAVDALHSGSIPWAYTAGVAGYTILYVFVVLTAGLTAFGRMEVK